jgi:NAD(P)H-hydrate epimerase
MEAALSLYSATQTRELDRRAIAGGVDAATLMARAGAAALHVLRARFPRAARIGVVCGPGNNGGDGYVVAALARRAGLAASVFTIGDSARASAAALDARREAESSGVIPTPFAENSLRHVDLVIDALLGIGVDRAVGGEWRAAIEAINALGRPVLAMDLPSGLNADTGAVMGAAVRADVTVSFIGLKAGLYTGEGRELAGEILFDDLGVPADIYGHVAPLAYRIAEHHFGELVRVRARSAHKGSFGHVLAVGGGIGMPGAAWLCGEAAYCAGAGLVTLATHPAHAASVNAATPELLAYGVRTANDIKPLLARASAIALGPGLSQTPWAQALLRAAIASELPLVVDADALNLLAKKPARRRDWILTPHPGEAARLLKTTAADIQQDRFAAARAIVKRYGGVCVLKGSGTVITDGDTMWVCDRGNPGLASAGTGDVLTGILAALCAQGLAALDAARLGVWLHATAGDVAAKRGGEIGLRASDLLSPLRDQLNRMAT